MVVVLRDSPQPARQTVLRSSRKRPARITLRDDVQRLKPQPARCIGGNLGPVLPSMIVMTQKPQQSAGILAYRDIKGRLEVLLIHPGGPFWAKRDAGTWSIPKGLYLDDEDALVAAKREFQEETGFKPMGEFLELGAFKQPSGKTVLVWAIESDFDISAFRSNTFSIEWPPRSGRMQEFPEADRAEWFDLAEARIKLTRGQVHIIDALRRRLNEA
jgi:predicted NUDIX family NTP pyrophosphohydrolase